jgi:hypothetical protein
VRHLRGFHYPSRSVSPCAGILALVTAFPTHYGSIPQSRHYTMIPAAALAAVTTEELSTAATLYGSLKQLRLRMTNADEAALDQSFELHIQNVLEKLDSRLPLQENNYLKISEISMARHGIYDASFQQAILLCHSSKFSKL